MFCLLENVKFVDEFNRLYKNPFLIKDVNLSAELRRTTADDVSYGPVIASIRNLVGLSYEEKLQRQVEKLNIPYRVSESPLKMYLNFTPDEISIICFQGVEESFLSSLS